MGWLLRRSSGIADRAGAGAGAGGIGGGCCSSCSRCVLGLQAYVQDVTIIDQEMVTAALWIKDNIPPDDLLVVHDIGAVGYFAPRPILDIAGLVSPEFVPLIARPGCDLGVDAGRAARKYLRRSITRFPAAIYTIRACVRSSRRDGTAAVRAGASNMTIYSWRGTACVRRGDKTKAQRKGAKRTEHEGEARRAPTALCDYS